VALGLVHGIASYLADEGHGILYGSDGASIFVAEEPPSPDETITVIELGDGRIISEIEEEHIIRVRVRDSSYEDGLGRTRAVYKTLKEAQGIVGGIHVAYVRATAPEAPLGRDSGGNEGGRWRFGQNYQVLTKDYDLV
jgi:hypothetical protein